MEVVALGTQDLGVVGWAELYKGCGCEGSCCTSCYAPNHTFPSFLPFSGLNSKQVKTLFPLSNLGKTDN